MGSASLIRNAGMAVIQVLISGGTLFFLYRYLLSEIGPAKVGIWAIVLSTAGASRISEIGFTGSAVKFTAKYIARGECVKASEIVETTILTIGIILAVVLALGYPVFTWLISKIIPPENSAIAFAIMPYALVSVWIGSINGVFFSGLEGCQRIDLRAWVSMLSSILFLGLVWVLVPYYDLLGLAWAQIGQGVVMLIASRKLLKRELPALHFFPYRFRYILFREMFEYGFNFQVASVCTMLFEPTTKVLIAKLGGLNLTAYYEMANRMVHQFRLLLVSANRAIVPRIAALYENDAEEIQKTYLKSYRAIFSLALPLFACLVAGAPLVSVVWIGQYEPDFVWYTRLLAGGFWINTLFGPAYFINQGTGMLRYNTLGHLVIGALNILLGYALGVAIGGFGVILGYVLALVIGSGFIVFSYHSKYQIPFRVLLPNESKMLLITCCTGLLAGWIIFKQSLFSMNILTRSGLSMALSVVIISPACWMHPICKSLIKKVTRSN